MVVNGHHLQHSLVSFFRMPTCLFTSVHKHIYIYNIYIYIKVALQLALCGGVCGLWFVVVGVVCIYVHVCACV